MRSVRLPRLRAAREASVSPATSSSFASGAGILVVSRYVVAVLGWSGTILIVHRLSTVAWGGYSLIFSVLGIVGLLSELRIGRIVMRQLANAREQLGEILSSYITFRFAIGVVSYAVAVLFMLAGRYSSQIVLGTVVGAGVLLVASIGTAIDVLFTAKLWARSMGAAMVAGQAVQFVLTVVLYVEGTHSIVLFCVPAVIFEVVALLWRLRRLPHDITLRWNVDLPSWREWLREVAPLAIGGALVSIYLKIDTVMLSQLRDLEAVGKYSIGYKFSDLIASLPVALGGTLLATLARLWPDDEEGFALAVQKAFVFLTMVAVPVAVEFAFFTRPAIALLYGNRYQVASLATKGLVLAVLIAFFTNLYFTALVAVRRNRLYPFAALVGLMINVGLNLVLIPRWSYNGAALVTLITEAAVFVILAAGAHRLPGVRHVPWASLWLTVLAGLVAAAAALLRSFIPWELAGVISLVTYCLVLALLRAGRDLVEWPPRSFPWPSRLRTPLAGRKS